MVDSIQSDRPRRVQATWHAHPNSTVRVETAAAPDGADATGANHVTIGGVDPFAGRETDVRLRIVPAVVQGQTQGMKWQSVRVVAGQKGSDDGAVPWQGWFSQSYGDAWPAPTVVYDASAGDHA